MRPLSFISFRVADGIVTVNAVVRKYSLQMSSLLSPKRRQVGRMSHLLVLIRRSTSLHPIHDDLVLFFYYDRRGDLQIALDLYRKAESYVPHNVKLKERWILFVVNVFLCNISRGKENF